MIPPNIPRRIVISHQPVAEKTIDRARKHIKAKRLSLSHRAARQYATSSDIHTTSNNQQVMVETCGQDGLWHPYEDGMSQSTGGTQLVSNAGQTRPFSSSRLSPESLSNTAGLQASDIAPSAGVLDSLGTVIEDSPLHVNSLFPRSTRLPCTSLLSPGSDWLANTPSRRLGLDLSVKRVKSYNQILHRGWQTFMARNLNDAHEFLLAVARTVQPLGKPSSHASEEILVVKARRLLMRMDGVNQHVQPRPNTDIISPREISELGFDQLLLGSMVNGFAGLGPSNIKSIAQYLGRSENTNLSFLKFPENCSSNTDVKYALIREYATVLANDISYITRISARFRVSVRCWSFIG